MSDRRVVVATAGNEAEAQIWVDALRSEGIRATTFEQSHGAALGMPFMVTATYPVLVPESRFDDAQVVIGELGGDAQLAESSETGIEANWLVLPAIVLALVVAFLVGLIVIVEAFGVW